MGDRISVSFRNGDEESVVLFGHWAGMSLVGQAKKYVKELMKECEGKHTYPLERMEPNTVMLDFIFQYFKDCPDERIKRSYYLGKDENDGDNSDNGHHVIDITKKHEF